MSKTQIKSGYTLIEMLVVIAIMVLLITMAIPFDLSYRKKAEMKQSVKQLRALFWEAQARALAPSSKYATSYKIDLIKNAAVGGVTVNVQECLTVPPAAESCSIVPGLQEKVVLGNNITVKDIQLDGASTAILTRTSFLVGNGRTAGQISFIQNGVTLNKNKMDVILGSKLDTTLSYDIIVDIPTNSITYK